MKIFKLFLVGFILSLVLHSCKKNKEEVFGKVPKLTYLSHNTDSINFQDTTSVLSINFEIKDGDGDIASRPVEGDSSIIAMFYDWTDDSLRAIHRLAMPQVSKSDFQKNGGLKANMRLDFEYFFFIPPFDPNNLTGRDTVKIAIYIQDYAGNKSDTFVLEPIYVAP